MIHDAWAAAATARHMGGGLNYMTGHTILREMTAHKIGTWLLTPSSET